MSVNIPEGTKLILFDGVCNLCNSAINFIISHDKKKIFRYASLQSSIGQQFLKDRNLDATALDSILLIEPNVAYHHKSTAALEIAKHLNGLYPALSIFLILPKTFRDWIYDIVAKNRYKWFGKKDNCQIPTPELKSLFMDQ
ncbi:thiol-disulfide oxidoreductase DCC family protein [Aquimarina intermedia]|uniref:Putative DCC family thiol-disulfide oxidoreductase YuxK n=1 Tax=Aquimarina intermedia TaxID=350814 RepID=A0A5S5BWS3_9FLAO|nr:DCC1-like thiol-disulfide oxidoreductase family protein [Aquimarina intermedia]TYP71454.1 putative DCC family thiol-disulfide oxidoreductase YuxK [Aquimarina intermedia]